MRFKLDENFGPRTQHLFRTAGHDVQTVHEELLSGIPDEQLYLVCQEEQRCLVSLDLDFANVLRFPPNNTGDIVVIRMPHNPSLDQLERLVQYFLNALDQLSLDRKLWIVELGRIRIHQPREDED